MLRSGEARSFWTARTVPSTLYERAMRLSHGSIPVIAALALVAPGPSHAQSTADAPPASAQIVEEVRELQVAFEQYRESRIPLSPFERTGGCDEQIGRICIWFGGTNETDFPAEPVESGLARRDLIAALYEANDQVRDPWVVGHLVHYTAEDGSLREAESVARQCDLVEGWWCFALLGYVLHLEGEFVEAEAAFTAAVDAIPEGDEDLLERWTLPGSIVGGDGREIFEDAGPEERARLWDLFWRLSDPLYLTDGNDRLTEHFARLVEARNQEEAENPQGIPWGEDLTETLVRYGRNTGYSRVRPPQSGLSLSLEDRRTVVGHHDPASRGYLFPDNFLPSPSDVPPESWITAPRAARTWYAPPYAPDFRALETQVARFRRGDEMLVVGAYRPAPPSRDLFADLAPTARNERPDPFASRQPAQPPPERDALSALVDPLDGGPVETALFLVPLDGGEAHSVTGTEREGVLTMVAPPGRYVSSLEVFGEGAKRAWRARQGVAQGALVRGLVAVSDLLILSPDAGLPETLDDAVPLARPGIRIAPGERFTVVWEVYGLQVQEEVQVTLGFTSGRPGFLARVGEFLGILEPDRPVEVTFADAGPDVVQTVFRSVQLNLPQLDPGDYTLHLRLELPGREPALASRPIIVEP